MLFCPKYFIFTIEEMCFFRSDYYNKYQNHCCREPKKVLFIPLAQIESKTHVRMKTKQFTTDLGQQVPKTLDSCISCNKKFI